MKEMIDFRKYPILKPLDKELKEYMGGVTLDYILSTDNQIKREAERRVDKILRGEELNPYGKEAVKIFYTTLYLVVALDNEILKKKFVEKETELMEKSLMKENDDTLLEIARILSTKYQELSDLRNESLKIKRKERRKTLIFTFKFSMNFINYLKVTKGLRKEDEDFSLSGRILKDGRVFLTNTDVARILAYEIRDMLYEAVNIRYESVPEEVKKMADEMKGKKTPPCILSLMKKKELKETEKAVLIVYLIDIGDYRDAEKISEELAKRFLGDRKNKYIVYSCGKMKGLGLCVENCGTLNPLQHYYGKALRL